MSQDTDCRIALPRTLEMSSIGEVYNLLKSAADSMAERFFVDMDEVAIVDTAAVQLLIIFLQSIESRGGSVEWENLSIQVYQAAAELGLEDALGC